MKLAVSAVAAAFAARGVLGAPQFSGLMPFGQGPGPAVPPQASGSGVSDGSEGITSPISGVTSSGTSSSGATPTTACTSSLAAARIPSDTAAAASGSSGSDTPSPASSGSSSSKVDSDSGRGPGPSSSGSGSDESTSTSSASKSLTSDWAGVIYESPSDDAFTAVYGTFIVPTPTPTGTTSGEYSASFWVGLQGEECLFRCGIDLTANLTDGETTYTHRAWYEWFPETSVAMTLDLTPGDQIFTGAVIQSATSGWVTVENLSTGQKANQLITSAGTRQSNPSAQWVAEDFTSGETGTEVPFAKWGTLTWTNATAETTSGATNEAGGAGLIEEIARDGQTLTDTSVEGSTINCVFA